MFQDALPRKRGFFAVLQRRGDARAAAMLSGGEILFRGKGKMLRVPAGKKLFGSAPKCLAIVPEEEVFYRLVSVSATQDAAAALREAVAALTLGTEDTIWEYTEIRPLAAESSHRDFAVWATSRRYLADYQKTMRLSGIEVVDFMPESMGLVKAIFPSLETSDAALIIAASDGRTVFTVFAGRAIHLSGVLPFGAKALGGGNEESEDRFLSEMLQAILWYKNRAFHEHGARHDINRIFLIGSAPDRMVERIAFNTRLHVDTPDVLRGAHAAFAPLIGALTP
jgi:hypothetical protein